MLYHPAHRTAGRFQANFHGIPGAGERSAGGGTISPYNSLFVKASGSLRTGGAVALVLDMGQRWVNLPHDLVTAKCERGEVVRLVSLKLPVFASIRSNFCRVTPHLPSPRGCPSRISR